MSQMLWDMAGVDALDVARSIFGEEVGYLAPFQSLETVVQGKECSVLRLGDRNFRIVYSDTLHHLITPLPSRVWIKQYDWLSAVTLSLEQLPALLKKATVRAPHRLAGLPRHQAVPARIDDIATLIWRHPVQAKPTVELHLAQANLDRLIKKIREPKG